MQITEFHNQGQLNRYAASLVAEQIRSKPDCVLGLATGSSPLGTYKELVSLYQHGNLDFSHVITFNLDEYCGINYDNEQSYHFYMKQNLFAKINISSENTHIPDASAPNLDAECLRYEQSIHNAGGIDFQLLGIGHDGHIGFNEPCDHFPIKTHCVDLAASTIHANARFFPSIDQVPTKALTMGIGTIMKARKILLIAFGIDKQEILQQALNGKVTPLVPTSVLQLHSNVTVLYGK
ncbi:MAG: glucosamine-6-phosphate deaminase [Clostridiales bacterium]|nr:glucosamine-6-phosphate deaminase [Clostridiales bacterium]